MAVDFFRHLAPHDFVHHPEKHSKLLITRDGMHVEQGIDEFAEAIKIIKGFRYRLGKSFTLLLSQLVDLIVTLIKGFFHGDLLVYCSCQSRGAMTAFTVTPSFHVG